MLMVDFSCTSVQFSKSIVPILLYQSGPNLARDSLSTLTNQISFESVYCITFQGRKSAILGKC